MNQDKIDSILTYMNLTNKKLFIENKYIFFKEFKDLKNFFIICDELSGEEKIRYHDNIFNLKFIHSFKGKFKIKDYCVSNDFKYSNYRYHEDDNFLTLTLFNELMIYELEIKPYNKIFVKKN